MCERWRTCWRSKTRKRTKSRRRNDAKKKVERRSGVSPIERKDPAMNFHDILARWSEWGWPLVANHLWQATLIFLFALAAARLLKRATARARYIIWIIASV